VWDHPHFEKIMSYQADDMRTFARASARWHDPAYLAAAQAIHHFLTTFLLSPEGAFYTSQDADQVPGVHAGEYFALDDAHRRALGIPRIDMNIYARENGWAIASLCVLRECTGDEKALAQAIAAAKWIVANRRINGGGFSHGDHDPAGPYLGDNLAMGRAFLALYESTHDAHWLDLADASANYIERNFFAENESNSPGVQTTLVHPGQVHRFDAEVDENISVVRFATELDQINNKGNHRKLAERAMRYLAAPEVSAKRGWLVGGLLLADQAMRK
jgi:uncharacterized protein YyaL (SSP411 family)